MQEAFRMLAARGLHWFDVLDVLAVALLFFFVLRQVRGTRALQMLLGVLALAVANAVSGWLDLTATHRLLQNLLFYIPFAIIVLFQEPIQKALAKLGGVFFGRGATLAVARRVARETAQASFAMAGRRHGALILFERAQGLKDIEETGIKVDAELTADLLTTLFYPGTALHDGAAVVVEDRVRAAGCYLPLSDKPLPTEYGTRHRAAVGVTELTDAVTVIVSEERGVVSLVVDGAIAPVSDAHDLEARLTKLLGGKPRAEVAQRIQA
jgi:diadenylate cyclase